MTVAVTDVDGKVLGIFRSLDAPNFGFDVAVQKARTVAFFARSDTADEIDSPPDLDRTSRVRRLMALHLTALLPLAIGRSTFYIGRCIRTESMTAAAGPFSSAACGLESVQCRPAARP